MIKLGSESADEYIAELRRIDPALSVLEWTNDGDPTDIDVAMV